MMLPQDSSMKYNNETLTLHAIEADQHGRPVYVSAMKARAAHALINEGKIKVDKWSEANPDGYQRNPIPTRYRKFGRFVMEKDGTSPTSALLFVRNADAVTIEQVDGDVRKLSIRLDDAVIHVPDGQHRLWGLHHAVDTDRESVTDFALPVTILVSETEDSRYEEAEQFYLINSNQKRVPTDLAQRYMLRQKEEQAGKIMPDTQLPMDAILKELTPYATRIIDLLREKEGGAWQGLIALPNRDGTAPITQNSFVESIKGILKKTADQGWTVGETADTIEAFWAAVRECAPDAMKHWAKDEDPRYIIRNTAGVFALNDLLEWCLGRVEFLSNPADAHNYVAKFEDSGLDYFESTWWAAGNQSGAAGFGSSRAAYKKIRQEIVGDLAQSL